MRAKVIKNDEFSQQIRSTWDGWGVMRDTVGDAGCSPSLNKFFKFSIKDNYTERINFRLCTLHEQNFINKDDKQFMFTM